MKWELNSGTQYLSSSEQISYGGNTYIRNRIKSISSFQSGIIDRKNRDFDKLTITLDNKADDGSSNFPFTVLDAGEILEDKKIIIYAYSPDANDAVLIWSGYSGRPIFDPKELTVDLSASFLFDTYDIPIPAKHLQQVGFSTLDTNRNKSGTEDETAIPLVYGAGNFKIRPTIYQARVEDGMLHVNFIVSGTAPNLPFAANDVVAGKTRLFDVTDAVALEFRPGGNDTVPTNLTQFPDGLEHDNVAYGYAAFRLTDEIKDEVEDLRPEDIKLSIVSGRPLFDTGLPSENLPLILKDILRDPNYGLGLANADFDGTALTSTAAYAGSRYQARVELHEQESLIEVLQQLLSDFHGYITFNNGLIQINCKRNNETAIATFATCDSGVSGRKIHEDAVTVREKDFSEVINQAKLVYRLENRHQRSVIMYDTVAQTRAGGTTKKVVEEEIELIGLYDVEQVKINGAILLREELNGDLFIDFSVPFWDGLDVAPGDIVEVRAPDIFNNASNKFFRLETQTFETGEEPLTTFSCQIYKSAIYDDNSVGIGFDLLRGSADTSSQGRPPDVTPVSVQIIDTTTNDAEGKMSTVHCVFTYPVVDLATEQGEGIYREYPIGAVQLAWRYTDESINAARIGIEVKYPTAQADFQIDHHKNRSIEVFFIALGHNRSRAALGYIPDPTKVSALSANLSATSPNASIYDSTAFTVNDLVFIERELDKVTAKGAGTLTFQSSGGNRVAQLDTEAIAHPLGTQVAVAELSYPSLVLALTSPRHTYKNVTGVVARQRPEGVRVMYLDPDATNREVFLIYWSSDSDAATNPAKLGSATPAWYLTDPHTPPAGVNLVKNDDLNKLIQKEDIGAAGVIIYVRVAARNGKHNFSAALSAIANNSWGDDAAPIVTNAPRVIPKKKGIRVVAKLPTLNMQTFPSHGKVELVLRAVGPSSAILGYLTDTNDVYESSASEYKFDIGLGKDKTFNVSPSDLLAIWPTIVELKIYDYVANAVGTSTASPIRTLTVATMEVDGDAVPGALVFPPVFSENTVDGDPNRARARMSLGMSVASGTFESNNIREISIPMIRRNQTNTANVGQPFNEIKVLSEQERTFNQVFHEWFKPIGEKYRIQGLKAINGSKHTETLGSLDFTSGNLLTPAPADATTVPAPGFGTVTRTDGDDNKQDDVPAYVLQNTAAPVLIEEVVIRQSINGGAYRRAKHISLKGFDQMYESTALTANASFGAATINVGSTAVFDSAGFLTLGTTLIQYTGKTALQFTGCTWGLDGTTNASYTTGAVVMGAYREVLTFPRKAGKTAQYQGTAQSVGNKKSSTTTSALQGATTSDVTSDDTAPVIASTPVFKYRNGAWHCRLKEGNVSQVVTLNKVELSINNGTNSINLDDLDSEVAVSGIVFYDVGNQFDITTVMSKDQIRKILGPTGNAVCAFRLTNAIGPTTSPNSAPKDLATLRALSKRTNHQQLFKNPAFTQNDGGANLDRWIDFNPNTNSLGTIQISSGRLRWEDVNARVWWRENSATDKRYLAQNMGKTMLVNDQYSIRFFVESNGSLTINFDFFIATRFQATGTADPNGTVTLTGTGTSFLTELRAGDEITINSETRTILSIASDTSLTVTVAFSNTAGGASIFVVSPQSEIIRMGNQSLTAGFEKQVEGTFTHFGFDQTRDKFIMMRPNGIINTAGPFLYFQRPSFGLGPTPPDFTLGWIDIPDFDTVPTGGGGFGQEPSGEVPGAGGFEIIQV